MINKDALQYLVNLGEENNPILELPFGLYSTTQISRVKEPKAAELEISTLTGLVDYIKAKIDILPENLLIHIKSYQEVNLYSPLTVDRDRENYVTACASLPNNIYYGKFIDTEQFNIMLQSSFTNQGDKEVLLKYTGLVRDEAVKDFGDNGVSQQVTVKTGVASIGQAVVPNPVTLAPYRTFAEIEQPESKFIFRMKEGPSAAIYEADGGAWKNEAIQRIKIYLTNELQGIDNVKIIA